jgi:hypothetical protein
MRDDDDDEGLRTEVDSSRAFTEAVAAARAVKETNA